MAKKLFMLLMPLLFHGITSFAQPDSNWLWWGGDYMTNKAGIYAPVSYWPYSPNPGARMRCAYWTDNTGNFWLFGGDGYDAAGNAGNLNDLWKYSGSNRWEWIKGDNSINQDDVYGVKGISNSTNKPGGRFGSITWTGDDGNLWLFGGTRSGGPYGNDLFYLNDLWKYNISTNEWTWIKGDNITNQKGVYGTMGIAADANQPGARQSAVGWKDLQGNLWLFGGIGYGGFDNTPLHLNDLWKYDVAANQWTWMKGSGSLLTAGVYGAQGVEAVANIPGARFGSAAWTDNSGYLWLWGGNGVSESAGGSLNDLWKYNIATGNWTWIKGSKIHDQPNTYGTKGIANVANTPCGRENVYHWKDASGNFWLFGGAGYAPYYQSANGTFNDLWRYQPLTNQWTWMKGDTIPGQAGLYNVGGVPNFIGRPGARAAGASWSTSWGSLYLFGGSVYSSGNTARFNDLWIINSTLIILPVRIVHFSASVEGDNANLQWQTESEVNFSHFNVQRSTDGSAFQTVAAIQTNDQAPVKKYSYTDKNAIKIFSGKLFYRLQMVDNDQKLSFSNIISIDASQTNSRSVIASNPVKDELKLIIDQLQNENVVVRITNMTGSNVRYVQLHLQKGRNVVRIDVSSLAKGIYVLSAQGANQTNNLKLIKQ